MEPRDVKAIRELTNSYLKQFHLAPVMDEEEVAHWFLPQEHIIDTFVVEVKIRWYDDSEKYEDSIYHWVHFPEGSHSAIFPLPPWLAASMSDFCSSC